MKPFLVSFSLLFFSCLAMAQQGNVIRKAWAFSVTTVGGAPKAVAEGEKVLTIPSLLVYIALTKPQKNFKVHLQNGLTYSAVANKINELPLNLSDNELIASVKGETLYELVLTKITKIVITPKIKSQLIYNSLIISYFANGKSYHFPVKKIINKNINLY